MGGAKDPPEGRRELLAVKGWINKGKGETVMSTKITSMFVVLLLSVLACGTETQIEGVGEVDTGNEEDSTVGEESAPPPTLANTFKVGDIISVGDLEMTVLGWEFSEGEEYFEPDDGNIFVVIDVVFENKGSEAEIISTLLSMELKDSTGRSYNIDLFATTSESASSPDGEIAPGEKVRGPVGFQVPIDAEGLIFVFDADIFGTGKVFVELY